MNVKNASENQRHSPNEPRRLGTFRQEGEAIGNEPNKIIDFNCTGSNRNDPNQLGRRRKVIGGILSQLIEEAKDQLADCEEQSFYHEKQAIFHDKRSSFYKNKAIKLQKKLDSLKNLVDIFTE